MIKMKSIIGVLIFLLFYTTSVFSQSGMGQGMQGTMPMDGVLKGKIVTTSDSIAMEYANIVLFSLRDSSMVTGTITDANGLFELKELPYGRFWVELNFIGFEKRIISDVKINPQGKVVDLGTITLQPASNQLEGVDVVADRNLVEYKLDKKIVNLSQDLTSAGSSVAEALENSSSVTVDIEGNVSLRGSTNFKVLIDGRPSPLTGSDALQQIPADAVERVEIITNPSAKYDPEGVGGIINIQMKKNKLAGFSGIINASVGTGDKYSTDVTLSYRTENINFYGGFDYSDNNFTVDGSSTRETTYQGVTTFLDTDADRIMNRGGIKATGGIDFSISPNSILAVSGSVGTFGFNREMDNRNTLFTSTDYTKNYSHSNSAADINNLFYNANIDFTRKFNTEGHELKLAVYTTINEGDDRDTQFEETVDELWQPLNNNIVSKMYTDETENESKIELKADYVFPISEFSSFEAGYAGKINNEKAENNTYSYDVDTQEWILNNTYTSTINFQDNVHALYTTYSNKISNIEFLLGLRGEFTDRLITNETINEEHAINRMDIFPSLHLSRSFENGFQLQTSYSRRINRPDGRMLDPFVQYVDEYNLMSGNPALKPEFVNSMEFNMSKRFTKLFISTELYYRIKTDGFTRIEQLVDELTVLRTMTNLNNEYSLGVELSVNYEPYQWMKLNLSGNIYNYKLEAELNSLDVSQTSNNYDGNMNLIFIFSQNSRLQLNAFYSAPSVTVQGKASEMFMTGFAYKHDFFDKKLNLTFQIRDIFRTGKHEWEVNSANYYSMTTMQRESPVFSISASYKINNYRKMNRERGEGMEFESEF